MVNSARAYADRRRAVRRTWAARLPAGFALHFALGAARPDAPPVDAAELALGDIVELDAPVDAYDTLLVKLVNFLAWASARYTFDHFLHADDDSYVRLDEIGRLLPTLPTARLYWGYMWNLTPGGAHSRPIRDAAAKSYMPANQWPCDDYPPFASGCAFLLSADLVAFILANRTLLRPFRLIDAGLGIWLSAVADVRYIHSDLVRPYRPLPLYQSGTIVQHYMRPEEFAPYHSVRLAYFLSGEKLM